MQVSYESRKTFSDRKSVLSRGFTFALSKRALGIAEIA